MWTSFVEITKKKNLNVSEGRHCRPAEWQHTTEGGDHETLVEDQLLDNEMPSGGGGLIGMGGMGIWGGMWGAPGAPGGRGGTDIPPGGGGGRESFGGRGPTPLMRGGGRFTPAAGGGPLDWGAAFSILKWNWRKNCEGKITKKVKPHLSCL